MEGSYTSNCRSVPEIEKNVEDHWAGQVREFSFLLTVTENFCHLCVSLKTGIAMHFGEVDVATGRRKWIWEDTKEVSGVKLNDRHCTAPWLRKHLGNILFPATNQGGRTNGQTRQKCNQGCQRRKKRKIETRLSSNDWKDCKSTKRTSGICLSVCTLSETDVQEE